MTLRTTPYRGCFSHFPFSIFNSGSYNPPVPTFFDALNELMAAETPFVTVTIVDVMGSVPQERGAKAIVTHEGLHFGTVGGGKVETKAITEAQRMLAGGDTTHFAQWNLAKDVGMTCGGVVKLYFETFNAGRWNIVIFGAGHVANALVTLLVHLDCHITLFDPRQEWIDKLPSSPKLSRHLERDLPAMVKTLPADAFVILMTMGHTTDKPILIEILRTRTFPYLGVIGSEAKAHILRRDIEEAGLPPEAQRAFHCPIGLDLGTSHPYEIAVSTIAQLIQRRDELRGTEARHG
jgi:xanthine dehydrogenase accessory factor